MKARFFALLGVILGIAMMPLRAQNCFSDLEPCPTSCALVDSVFNWNNELVSTLGIGVFTGAVRILHTLTVDVDTFVFDGAQVGVLSGSVIVVKSGSVLRIRNSVLTSFQSRWQGIVLEPGASLLVDNSSICGADLAIQATGADPVIPVEVRDSWLYRNGGGVWLGGSAVAPYPFAMTGTLLEGFGAESQYGVRLSDMASVEVGSALPASSNTFRELDRGIWSESSSAQVSNNEFEDIQDLSATGQGYAVWAQCQEAATCILRVGTSVARSNRMKDCRIGVYARGLDSVNVSDNTMWRDSGLFERGVEVSRTQVGIVVGADTLRGFSDRGIYLYENPSPGAVAPMFSATVNGNVLQGAAGAGIRGVLVMDMGGELRVRSNTIQGVLRGITVQDAPLGTQVRVDANEVAYRYLAADGLNPAAGIALLDVAGPLVYHNNIRGNCGSPCSVPTSTTGRIRGMQLFGTSDARVFSNYVEQSGAGLYILQANTEGNAVCNAFHNTYSGVVWDDLPSGGFGISVGSTFRVFGGLPDLASDNTWTSSLPTPFEPIRSFSINGSDAATVQWYHRNTPTFDFPAGTNLFDILSGATLLSLFSGVESPICDSLAIFGESALVGGGGSESDFGGGDSPADLSEAWESLLDAESSWDNPSPALYSYLEQAYHQGLTHPKVEAALDRTQIRELAGLQEAWRRGDPITAQSICNSLSPVNTTEAGLKDLWQIRLSAEQEDRPGQYSGDELEVLNSWAAEDAWHTGSAWVMAQGMLGRSELPGVWNLEATTENRLAITDNLATLFPNPAQDVVFVQSSDQASELTITDIQCRVWVREAVPAKQQVAVSVAEIPVGLYLVELRFLDGQVAHRDKLYIQR
jgi:hypothetical protein